MERKPIFNSRIGTNSSRDCLRPVSDLISIFWHLKISLKIFDSFKRIKKIISKYEVGKNRNAFRLKQRRALDKEKKKTILLHLNRHGNKKQVQKVLP